GPLVAAAPGGRAGGAAGLTPRGRAGIYAFCPGQGGVDGALGTPRHQPEGEMAAALAKLEHNLAGHSPADLFWSLGMKTSARNALRGVISDITPGAISGEVTLSLAYGVSITAILTRHSIEELGLEVGKPAIALIKASFIVLAKGDNLRTSARNQIPGAVVQREDGAVNSEITLDIGGGKTLVATITVESANALQLRVGDMV